MSVCPSTHISQKPHIQISPNFLYVLSVAMTRPSSDGSAICYVLSVLWMTSCFHVMERMAKIKDDAYVSSNSPGGSTGYPTASGLAIVATAVS